MPIPHNVAKEAAEALRWVLNLRLSPREWERADQVMAMVDNAVGADDHDALLEAVFDLDQLARRVKEKMGTESDAPPSPRQRDRANELVHRLTTDPATNAGKENDPQN